MTDTNYKWEVGKWYKTRGGLDAKISDVNFNGKYGETLAGKIKDRSGGECVRSWYSNGRWSKDFKDDQDLMPPVETKELWVNVYYDPRGTGKHATKLEADKSARDNRIGQLKITIIGDDYTVEKVEL